MQCPAAERLADELELAAANCVWFEIEDELRAGVVGLRMRELPDAEAGLHDLADRAHRGMLCRVVVERLAEAMAGDIRLTAS